MRYEMFLYKTTAFSKEAPFINTINRAIYNKASGCSIPFGKEHPLFSSLDCLNAIAPFVLKTVKKAAL